MEQSYSIIDNKGEVLIAYYVDPNDNEKVLRVKRFIYENLIYSLLILATEFKKGSDDPVVEYAEHLENDVNVSFRLEVLAELKEFLDVNQQQANSIISLREKVMQLISPQWHRYMYEGNLQWHEVNQEARSLLIDLNISYQNPEIYESEHMIIDWT